MKKMMIGLMALTLTTSAFAFGRDSDVDYLVESYKEELKKIQSSESKKEKEKQKAISAAQGSVDAYKKSIDNYSSSIVSYEKKYLEPARVKIERERKNAEGYRNKLKEYEAGLQKALKEERYDSKGFFGSENGAADFKELKQDAQASLEEAEKLEKKYQADLVKFEGQKKSYESIKAAKLLEMETAKGAFDKAEGNLKSFRKESQKHMSSSQVPTLNAVVGQMVQRSKNGSLEAEMLLRDLDNLSTKLGVSKQELQNVFASNPELREKIGNTAMGGYVNAQIANAMGSICEYQNMCAAKGAEDLKKFKPEIVRKSLGHLYDKNRGADVVKALGEKPEVDTAVEKQALGK